MWMPGLLLLTCITAFAAFTQYIKKRTRGSGIVAGASLLAVSALAFDCAVLVGLLAPTCINAVNLAFPILLVALTSPLIDRFMHLMYEAELARNALEERVKEREKLLKKNFERLRQVERRQVETQERQRIMQDMHDGLGSQLLSSLMTVEAGNVTQPQMVQILRECIDDLRLAIDALAPEELDFMASMGNLRFRLEPRFKAAGISLSWDARQVPEEVSMHQDAILPILRIVQEAMANTLKHSRARNLKIAMSVINLKGEGDWLVVQIKDDGNGQFKANSVGHGLNNMRTRAHKLGAQLDILPHPNEGTLVQLRYPLPDKNAMEVDAEHPNGIDTKSAIEQTARFV